MVYGTIKIIFFRDKPEWGVVPAALERRQKVGTATPDVQVYSFFVGMYGFYAGPYSINIEELGLADPLISRLPATIFQRAGHYFRTVPAGYEQMRRTKNALGMQRDLAIYYRHLRMITSAPLLNTRRLKTILDFQLGRYDNLLKNYVAQNHADDR